MSNKTHDFRKKRLKTLMIKCFPLAKLIYRVSQKAEPLGNQLCIPYKFFVILNRMFMFRFLEHYNTMRWDAIRYDTTRNVTIPYVTMR